MTREIKIKIFGGEMRLYDYDISTAIQILESLKKEVRNPQILSYSGLETIDFHTVPYDEYSIGYECIQWIFNQNKSKETEYDIRQCLLDCSVEDEDWTKRRNRDYIGIVYRKVTFLPKFQDAVVSEISKYISELQRIAEKIKEETE